MSDRRERANDTVEEFLLSFEGQQAGLWTALPGIIQSFNAGNMTCVVQPAIQGQKRDKSGVLTNVNLPLLLDCPTQFLGSGGFTFTHPIKKGDECLVIFASRCIDAWWQQGGVQPPAEYRMHDLSDGFVILGFRSVPRVLSGISLTTAQLRTDDGSTYVEIANGGIVNIVAPSSLTIISPQVTITGNLAVDEALNVINSSGTASPCMISGSIHATGNITGGSIDLQGHVHTGVMAGGANTGGPTG